MRLTEQEIENIKLSVHKVMGDKAEVWLFGSRVDDNKRGGDIDLYIEPNQELTVEEIIHKRILLAIELKEKLGDQRIDIVIADGSKQAIYQEARKQGIRL